MSPVGYAVEVTGLSPEVSYKDVYEFFSYCGDIEHLEIVRYGEYACSAYVTFEQAYGQEVAVILSGSTLGDQTVSVSPLNTVADESGSSSDDCGNVLDSGSWSEAAHVDQFVSTPGEIVTVTQQVVRTMVEKGYVLSKDALAKAKAIDETHHVTSTAAAKVAELSKRIGLTDKINSGMAAVKSVDQKYHVSDRTMSVASYTGKTAIAAANAVINSSYFARGALWVSDVLDRASKTAADLGNKGVKQ